MPLQAITVVFPDSAQLELGQYWRDVGPPFSCAYLWVTGIVCRILAIPSKTRVEWVALLTHFVKKYVARDTFIKLCRVAQKVLIEAICYIAVCQMPYCYSVKLGVIWTLYEHLSSDTLVAHNTVFYHFSSLGVTTSCHSTSCIFCTPWTTTLLIMTDLHP